jgi:hypothetical protein
VRPENIEFVQEEDGFKAKTRAYAMLASALREQDPDPIVLPVLARARICAENVTEAPKINRPSKVIVAAWVPSSKSESAFNL